MSPHDPLCPYAGWPTKRDPSTYCQCHFIDTVAERERRDTRTRVAGELRALAEQARTAPRGVLTSIETQAAVLHLAAERVEQGAP